MPSRYPRSRRSDAVAFPSVPPILKLSHDTVALICDLLLPKDVLSLYRSCKAAHSFLKLDSSRRLWKAARANVKGLPECPEWLGEPQYASLCFEDFCFGCLTTDAYSRSPIWPFGVRYCLPCRGAMLTPTPFEAFPSPAKGALGHFKSPTEVLPGLLTTSKGRGGPPSEQIPFFHIPAVERLRNIVTALVYPLAATNTDADPAVTKASVLAVLRETNADTKSRLEFAHVCKTWHAQWMAELERAARVVRSQRRQDILSKLRGLGYANEIRDLGPRYEGLSGEVRAFVDQARPLNDREWNVIRPAFTAFMDVRRQLAARVSYVRLIRSRLRVLKFSLFEYLHEGVKRDKRVGGARAFPTMLDLLDIRDAAYLIMLPDGAVLLPHLWAARLPIFVETWQRGREELLLSLLHGTDAPSSSTHAISLAAVDAPVTTRSAAPPSSSLLSHPAALFWCGSCLNLVPAIVAMSHACCYGRAGPNGRAIFRYLNPSVDGRFSEAVATSDSEECLYKKTVVAFSEGILPWSHEHLQGCVPVARAVLKACGVELDDLPRALQQVSGVRLACRTCCQAGKCVLAMTWLRAIRHAFEAHDGQQGSWVRLPPQLEDRVRRIEYTSRKVYSDEVEAGARWECSRCTWDKPEAGLAYTWPQLVEHFRKWHPVTNLSSLWYRWSKDSPPFMYPAVLCVERGAEGNFEEDLGESFPRKHLVASMKLSADIWSHLRV